jgi:hypothetical protein
MLTSMKEIKRMLIPIDAVDKNGIPYMEWRDNYPDGTETGPYYQNDVDMQPMFYGIDELEELEEFYDALRGFDFRENGRKGMWLPVSNNDEACTITATTVHGKQATYLAGVDYV